MGSQLNRFFDGYMAEVHFIDGRALDASTFGEFDATTGIWNPVEVNISSPNNGTVWSSFLSSAAGFDSNNPASNAFDPSTSSKAQTPQNTGGYTTGETNAFEFIPPSPIAYTSSVKIRGRGTGQTTMSFRIDTGSGYGSATTTSSDVLETVVTGSGNLVKLKVWTPTYSGENELAGEENDGHLLIDGAGTHGFNGFHLDFNPSAGQVYSSGTLTGSIHSGNPLTRAFDGSTSTGTWAGSGSGFELTFPSAEPVANSITVIGGSTQSNYKVIVDGTEHTITFPNGSSSYTQEVTVSVSGSFTGIKATSKYGEIRGIRVDGKFLIDSSAPGVDASGGNNHWTANNIDGYTARNPLTTTAHRYWRAVLYDHSGSHWPRMSKLYMYEADGTRREHKNYTSDNCNDQGSIPTNGGVYDTDYGSGNSYNFRNIGIYSTYNGGNRAGRAEVFYSDDNSNWTYSFESYVETNSQCGERIGTVTAELLPGDIAIDTPTNFKASSGNNVGNYCTLNPLQDRWNIGSSGTRNFSQGNLKITATTGDSTRSRYLFGTIPVSSGKWYYEMTADNTAGGIGVGFAPRQFADEDTSISVRYNSPGSIIIDGTTHSSPQVLVMEILLALL